jgi:gamma-glutamyltranspeptidase/glutathione hydrolase
VVESAKLAFADREAWYGDPDFVDVPLTELLDPAYADDRRTLVGDEASRELRPGAVGGCDPRLPSFPAAPAAGSVGAGEPTVPRNGETYGDTTHIDIVDRHGNMVAATPSGGWLQSSPVVPELGFCLTTRAQMFWLYENLPNSLAGRKKPRTTLTPSLALREGAPYMAFGTPGGDQQDQWSLTFFLAHVHFGLNLQEAIDAPMFHTNHFPSSFYPRAATPGEVVAEARLDPAIVAALRARGHDVTVVDDWSLGRLSAVSQDLKNGLLRAAANPRGTQGYAVGR